MVSQADILRQQQASARRSQTASLQQQQTILRGKKVTAPPQAVYDPEKARALEEARLEKEKQSFISKEKIN